MTRGATFSAAFWRWFGDSQVVDVEGRPQVVYHATNKAFDVFNPEMSSGFYGAGIYVTADKKAALDYGERVLALYARAENPLDIRHIHAMAGTEIKLVREALAPYGIEPLDETRPTLAGLKERALDLRRKLKAAGFDSVRYTYGRTADAWVLFDANQVKSVDNEGTWSRSSDVIKNPSFTTRSDVARDIIDTYAEMLGESYVGFEAHEIYVYRRWDRDTLRFEVAEADLEQFADSAYTLGNEYDEIVERQFRHPRPGFGDADLKKDYRLLRDAMYAVARQARKKARGT